MSCANTSLATLEEIKPAAGKEVAKTTSPPVVVDELRILGRSDVVRDGDELALFGLTPSEAERRRRKSRLI